MEFHGVLFSQPARVMQLGDKFVSSLWLENSIVAWALPLQILEYCQSEATGFQSKAHQTVLRLSLAL